MKVRGIIRKTDHVGKLTLPAGMRRSLGINSGDSLEFFEEEGGLVLRKYDPVCMFCGQIENIVLTFYSRKVCDKCLSDLRIYADTEQIFVKLGGIKMVNQAEVAREVKAYLPRADDTIVDEIVSAVIQDAESIIHSLIRQAVAQERDKLYRQKGDE